MKNKKQKTKVTYEPEADVLMWELSGQAIDFAEEVGNVIVHFTKSKKPVLVEILEASKFLASAERLVQQTGVHASHQTL